MRPVWADVDLDAVTANVRALRAVVGPVLFCAVVKADGYGHGAVPVASAALAGGADLLGVALVAEGAELRDAGSAAPILVLSQASPDELDVLVGCDLEATAYTEAGVAGLAAAARRAGRGAERPVRVHLKVDTGMHRVGAQPDEVVALARSIDVEPGLALASVFTHCAVADEPDDPFTAEQLRRYEEVLADLAAAGIDVPLRHAANTAAAIAHPDARYDVVRCGIGIYGLDPSAEVAGRVPLRPAMALRSRVSHVKRVAAGEGISYGLRYRPERETTIATVPLGYADGVPRALSSVGAEVLVGGRRRPIAGTVTMDQFLVDCGDDPVAVGDDVVLLGEQGGDRIGADDWARRLGTISYEIVCGISTRVPRRYLETDT
ncbi:alanine racemase [Aquihabitans sp. G128]|uniref:alanine racemase n=1 Tax=Aquihabitans sp. G128 TaxID=2849779 RepID=UPI001C247799|nr:alanine racemase [Aquihabitans sp. G128]QXC60350.1 alanine racemase [Aquihabitans sp. G128]